MNQKENNTEISFTWDSESEGYYKRHKLSNGQFCQIGFYRWNGSRSIEYHVAFAVADKKKNLNGWFNQTKDMQVDHVIPINGWSEQGEDTLDNMLPACRSCNHYKSRSTLEGFRKMVENMPTFLMRDSVTYKNAVRFGLVTPTPHPVKFYFEQLGR